ncbi:hypothetical protein PR048_012620 [Dryococelus australis]|uniref:Uncharacterized protein n=1 Tax=Dryococelus australis TaxID=614101 RepID=A0ABQ9HPV9_9NEOP|nr:hypothetical protein PR048_012620 [Dryococelus australis]
MFKVEDEDNKQLRVRRKQIRKQVVENLWKQQMWIKLRYDQHQREVEYQPGKLNNHLYKIKKTIKKKSSIEDINVEAQAFPRTIKIPPPPLLVIEGVS